MRIRAECRDILAPTFQAIAPVCAGIAQVDQLVDGFTRILGAACLIPDAKSEKVLERIAARHCLLGIYALDADLPTAASTALENA